MRNSTLVFQGLDTFQGPDTSTIYINFWKISAHLYTQLKCRHGLAVQIPSPEEEIPDSTDNGGADRVRQLNRRQLIQDLLLVVKNQRRRRLIEDLLSLWIPTCKRSTIYCMVFTWNSHGILRGG